MNSVREASNFNLKEARKQVTKITEAIVDLFCERQGIMQDIANAKSGNGEEHLPIYLPQREQELLARFRVKSKEKNVDPDMMDMLVSMLMSAAKFAQMDILQRHTTLDTTSPEPEQLREDLLALTSAVAETYDEYDESAEGTHMECVREGELLQQLSELHQSGVVVNLGCANGTQVTKLISSRFERVIGYDISPHMIECAKGKFPDCEFYVHDLDTGIPLEDESIDLVIANFGAASEVCKNLWQETARVLRPGGRAYFSFYNQAALVTQWWTPWSNSYRITINPHNDTIMVPIAEENGSVQVYWIYGRSVDEKDIYSNARAHGFELRRVESSSPLWDDKPREFFKHQAAVQAAMEYDKAHAHVAPYLGQYLRVVVKKVP